MNKKELIKGICYKLGIQFESIFFNNQTNGKNIFRKNIY